MRGASALVVGPLRGGDKGFEILARADIFSNGIGDKQDERRGKGAYCYGELARHFTEALRSEFAARSEIEVCCVYLAHVDTPTYPESANYAGGTLRPVPPVVLPERVAERIIGLALRPRRSVRVGAANAAPSVPFARA